MAADYTYLATDLVTNTVLGELPVAGVRLDCQLGGAGNMQCSGHLDDERIKNEDFIARTIPGRTAFWAYRSDLIVWGGIFWTRTYQSDTKVLTFTGQTFESYAARRFPREWLGTQVVTYNAKQSEIIDLLWIALQGVQYGNIGVAPYGIYDSNDTVIELTVNGWDLSTSVDDIIQNIVQGTNGPDYTIAWNEDGNGMPTKQLIVAPRIGNPISSTGLVTDYPGGIMDYTYSENASSGATQWWAVGDGSDAATTVGKATALAMLQSGYPILGSVNNYSGVTKQPTIDAHATSDLKTFPVPLLTHTADFSATANPPFGTYGLGDYIQQNIEDPRFPNGIVVNERVVGWTISPPDNNEGTETITPVFDEPTGTQ